MVVDSRGVAHDIDNTDNEERTATPIQRHPSMSTRSRIRAPPRDPDLLQEPTMINLRHAASVAPSVSEGSVTDMPDANETLELRAAGHEVRITHPNKEFFPRVGLTKSDLARYYLAVAEPVMGAMGGRPVLLERYPDGVPGKSFFQKRVAASRPDWLRTTIVSTPNGTTSEALVINDIAHVLWAVNLGCPGFHVWAIRAADPMHADELRFDLDPMPKVTFEEVRTAAGLVRALLEEVGIRSWIKTSGSKGLHVYVPLQQRWGAVEVRSAAVAAARELARRHPDLLTDAWWKEERGTTRLPGFQPERSSQDDVRCLVGTTTRREPRCPRRLLGMTWRQSILRS